MRLPRLEKQDYAIYCKFEINCGGICDSEYTLEPVTLIVE